VKGAEEVGFQDSEPRDASEGVKNNLAKEKSKGAEGQGKESVGWRSVSGRRKGSIGGRNYSCKRGREPMRTGIIPNKNMSGCFQGGIRKRSNRGTKIAKQGDGARRRPSSRGRASAQSSQIPEGIV